ncbi:hypothetical protein EVAR_28510_1 [Eumeta japonica]|uniref:Uncharacterized protein n=1 Tax=Eumeta variegata TaxID=151549 RepID=A0A4C1WP53_EUMVA|nr:hypothetical protein EVAR_28510_1 [Eumeta japonica]
MRLHSLKVIKAAILEEWQKQRYAEGNPGEITKCFFPRVEERATLEAEIYVQIVRRNFPEILEDITKRENFLDFCVMVVERCKRMSK